MPPQPPLQSPNVSLRHSMEGMEPNERFIGEIRKHPFGLAVIYMGAAASVLLAFGLVYVLLPDFLSEHAKNHFSSFLSLAFVVVAGICLLMSLVASYVYHQNKLIISSKNLTQVLQHGLFHRTTSELSFRNVEDVTADQRGVFAMMFNFGTLRVETAGEQNNFHFNYCPNPNYYGRMILNARQCYLDDQTKSVGNQQSVPATPARQGITS